MDIYLIEPDEDLRSILVFLTRYCGYEVTAVAALNECTWAAAQTASVVLMHLPDSNEPDRLLRELVVRRGAAPTLVLTQTDTGQAMAQYRVRAAYCFSLPLCPSALRSVLGDLVNRHLPPAETP